MQEHELGVFGSARPLGAALELGLAVDGGDTGVYQGASGSEVVYDLATVRLRRSNPPQQSRA